MGKRFLWDVLGPRHGEGSLFDELNPWVGDWLLWDVFEISVFDWRRLEDLDVLDWVGGRHDSLDGLEGSVVNLIPAVIDDGGEVIEGVVVVEVGVAHGWRSPRGLGHIGRLDHHNVVVRVVVVEVVVVQVSGGDATSNSGESGVLGEDGVVIVGVHVVEVLVGNPGIRMGDGCLDSSVDKDGVVVVRDVVKEVQVRNLKLRVSRCKQDHRRDEAKDLHKFEFIISQNKNLPYILSSPSAQRWVGKLGWFWISPIHSDMDTWSTQFVKIALERHLAALPMVGAEDKQLASRLHF